MKSITIILTVALIAGAGSFFTTLAASPNVSSAPSTAPLDRWLSTDASQQRRLVSVDPTFQADVRNLDQKIIEERDKLTSLVGAAGTIEAQALEQVDRLSAAQCLLQKRVVTHLVRIRPLLTPDQQQQLTSLYTNCLRNGGSGAGMGRGGMGRGPGPHGYGYGRGRGSAATTAPSR